MLFRTATRILTGWLFLSILVNAQDIWKPGTEAPALQAKKWLQAPPDFDGQLSRLQGKVVVVDFWATWCGACVAAIPHMNQLAEGLKSEPVVFLSISDDDEFVLRRFLTDRPVHSWLGLDPEGVSWKRYQVPGLPLVAIIDRKGRIAAITLPEHLDEEAIRKVLNGEAVSLPVPPSRPINMSWDVDEIDWRDGIAPDLQIIIKPIRTAQGGSNQRDGHYVGDGMVLGTLIKSAFHKSAFEIDLKLPESEQQYRVSLKVPKDQAAKMDPLFQQTLITYFDLDVRTEIQERDVYVLTATKGLAASGSKTDLFTFGRGKATGRNQSMQKLRDFLINALELFVVDESGLAQKYDWDLTFQPGTPATLIDDLKAKLGLEVRRERRKVPILVVRNK